LCSSMPVFFINEASKLEKLMDAFTVNEAFDRMNSEKFWNFIISNPESLNCALRLFSHQGLSDSFINMKWFSNNTYIWKNSDNDRFLVRCRWYPIIEDEDNAERKYLDRNIAEFMAGIDPDRAINDIKASIKKGLFPSYELQIQMMKYSEAVHEDNLKYTLKWDENVFPYVSAGMMKLISITEDHLNDCDRMSFAPSCTIKGIEIYRDDLSEIFDWIYKVEAAERGVAI